MEESGYGTYFGWEEVVEYYDEDDFQLEEFIEAACWLEGWTGLDGAAVNFGRVEIMAGELMPEGRLDPEDPDSERVLEASGNEGATIERLYRRAALVVWPKENIPGIMGRAGAGSLVSFLAAEWERVREGVPISGSIRELALQVVEHWPARPHHAVHSREGTWAEHCTHALELLCSIGNREATGRFLNDVVISGYDGAMNGALVTTAAAIGVGDMREPLCELAISRLEQQTESIVDLASALCERLDDGGDASWHAALRDMVTIICVQMPSVQRQPKTGDHIDWHRRTIRAEPNPLPTTTLNQLFRLLWRFNLIREVDAAVTLISERADLATPDRSIPALLNAMSFGPDVPIEYRKALGQLWLLGANYLLSRSEHPPQPPANWVISSQGLTCKCEYCAELRRFCKDPASNICHIRVRQDIRAHLRNEIDRRGIDIRYETERTGRPYALVCTKTRRAFDRRMAEYRQDIAEMSRLVQAAKFAPDSATALNTLQAAVDRGR